MEQNKKRKKFCCFQHNEERLEHHCNSLHSVLIIIYCCKNLNTTALRGPLALFKSYLHSRKQAVVNEFYRSRQRKIEVGVPQSSVLGQLFFLLNVDNLATCSNLRATLYADDSVLTIKQSFYFCLNQHT